jgi:octaprenyl-diphosphate synthase
MSEVSKIKAPISEHIDKFEPYFKKNLKSNVPLLDIVTNYIIRRQGKQMRPMLVFLSAKLVGEVNQATYTAAALIELLHTATLIHDDVVDESYTRRGFFSIKALWKSKIAVLVGDFLLSKGLLLATENKEYEILQIVSVAVKEMAEGELLQIEKARRLDIDEEIYFDVIYKKTATLIAACSAAGAKSARATDEITEKLKLFGKYAGIAFQLKDDLFDYEKTNMTGKPAGNDIQEKKMTLPLIYALKNSSKPEKKEILNIIKKHNKDSKKVQFVIDFVNQKGGIIYAEQKMNEYKKLSLDILDEFPQSEAKESLKLFIEYISDRKK